MSFVEFITDNAEELLGKFCGIINLGCKGPYLICNGASRYLITQKEYDKLWKKFKEIDERDNKDQ